MGEIAIPARHRGWFWKEVFGFYRGCRSFWTDSSLGGNQLRYANQVVADEIEEKISGDDRKIAMFGGAHRALLLAPSDR